MDAGLARVTINAPERRVDVALPEHVPLADLLPEVLHHAGDGLADVGEGHGGWLLRRADGVPLSGGQSLHTQGVRDGEILHLVAARAGWPELEYDDVVEAIADGARRRGVLWTAGYTRAAATATAGLALAVALVALLRAGPDSTPAMLATLGVAATLTLAGILAARALGQTAAGVALAAYSLPYAFAAGALLLASGPLRPVDVLLGSAALVVHSVLGLLGVGAGRRIFAGGGLAGVLGVAAAAIGFGLGAASVAAIVAAALVCGVGLLPLLAIRLGRLPTPPVTLDAPAPPDREAVFGAVARTEEWLSGLLLGHAVAAVVAFVVLVYGGGAAGGVLVGVCAVALVLRARLFVAVRQRVPLLAAGVGGAVVLGTSFTGGAALAGAVGLVVALVVVAAGARHADRPPGPYLGRAADLLDTALVVAVVPVACAVLGLYGRARELVG